MPESRPLVYNAFLTDSLSHIHHGMWRNPATRNVDFNSFEPWLELAKLLERGLFDTVFFADTLGPMDDHLGGVRTTVREGLQIPAGDPIALIPALLAATENLGFVFTSSILREHPYVFARLLTTLDHLAAGRIGWNIVTSSRGTEARALGLAEIPPHAERYAWAEEYMEVVYKLWEGSWEDAAVILDADGSGRYADEARVHEIHHRGPRYTVDAIHPQAPSPQRTPVLFQAGGSPVGRAFAARHAEGTFLAAHDPDSAASAIADTRAKLVAAGRRPDDILFIQGITFVVGSTEDEAARLSGEVDEWLSETGMLAHMSGTIGLDLGSLDLDLPVGDYGDARVQGVVRGLLDSAPGKPKTLRELSRWAWSERIAGTPESIADEIERWAQAGVDGFNVIHITTPGTYAEFIDFVAPVLQRRGLMQREYGQGVLRQKLYPSRGPRLPERHPATGFGYRAA